MSAHSITQSQQTSDHHASVPINQFWCLFSCQFLYVFNIVVARSATYGSALKRFIHCVRLMIWASTVFLFFFEECSNQLLMQMYFKSKVIDKISNLQTLCSRPSTASIKFLHRSTPTITELWTWTWTWRNHHLWTTVFVTFKWNFQTF